MRRCRARAVIDFERAFKNRDVEARLRGGEGRNDADWPGADDDKFELARSTPCSTENKHFPRSLTEAARTVDVHFGITDRAVACSLGRGNQSIVRIEKLVTLFICLRRPVLVPTSFSTRKEFGSAATR